MDLLCTENIVINDYEQQHQHQHQKVQPRPPLSSTYVTAPISVTPTAAAAIVTLSTGSTGSTVSASSCHTTTGYSSDSSCGSSTGSRSRCRSHNHNSAVQHAGTCTDGAAVASAGAHHQLPMVTTTLVTVATVTNAAATNGAAQRSYEERDGGGGCGGGVGHYQQHQHHHQQVSHNHNNNNSSYDNAYNAKNVNVLSRTISSVDFVNTATEDPTFLTDRCLENALKAEVKRPQPVCAYFKTVQEDITPPMRKIVAEWMMEVCAEEKCQEEVVLLALNYMDRFLSSKAVRKTHLQILAAACLLLASKLREPSCRALSAELLVFYTDNSIFKSDLIKWELFVLSRLGWDLSSVTPLDFLELLLIRLPIRSTKCPDLNVDKVRQHAQAFISLAAKEHYFSMYSASTIAASSIAAALSGLNWHLRTGQNLRNLLNLLTDLTSVEQDYMHDCMMKMESIFEEHSRNLQPYLVSVESQQHQQLHQQHQQQQQQSHQQQMASQQRIGVATAHAMLPDLTQTCKMQANAQKDVQDIKF